MQKRWYDNGQIKEIVYYLNDKQVSEEEYRVALGVVFYYFYGLNDKQVSEEEYREYKLVCQLAGIEDE